MACGQITNRMLQAIRPFIQDRQVVDLGAGDGLHARKLASLKPASLTCVDKEWMPEHPNYQTIRGPFSEIHVPSFDTAFLAWPSNYSMPGLVRLLGQAQFVIYMGFNDSWTTCGWEGLFRYFTTRELLAEVPYRKNNLIVLGDVLDQPRPSCTTECDFLLAMEAGVVNP